MPVCFELTRKGEEKPTTLPSIDDELCLIFNEEAHPRFYFCGWYDAIGFRLALGKSWDDIEKEFQEYLQKDIQSGNGMMELYDRRMLAILGYLRVTFTAEHWRESKH